MAPERPIEGGEDPPVRAHDNVAHVILWIWTIGLMIIVVVLAFFHDGHTKRLKALEEASKPCPRLHCAAVFGGYYPEFTQKDPPVLWPSQPQHTVCRDFDEGKEIYCLEDGKINHYKLVTP